MALLDHDQIWLLFFYSKELRFGSAEGTVGRAHRQRFVDVLLGPFRNDSNTIIAMSDAVQSGGERTPRASQKCLHPRPLQGEMFNSTPFMMS